MKCIFLQIILLFSGVNVTNAQEQDSTLLLTKIYSVVEEMPVYEGCMNENHFKREECTRIKIQQFLLDEILPLGPEKLRPQLGKIYMTFIINENGIVTNPDIQIQDSKLNKEVINKLLKMPKFTPGKQNNIPVKVKYKMPFYVRIE